MLHNRSFTSAAASYATFGSASFAEQSEGAPLFVLAHGGGGGGGTELVGVVFMSPAQTGTAIATASNMVANGFRQIFISGLLNTMFLVVVSSLTAWSKLEVPGERIILAS